MIDPRNFIMDLLKVPGLSGYEKPVRLLIEEAWRPLVDNLSISKLGSLHGYKAGVGGQPRPSILISAHMDAIGLIVTGLSSGYIRFTDIGRVDPRCLPGQAVTIHGRKTLPGVIITPPAQLLPHGQSDKSVEIQYLFIDTGLSHEEIKKLVRVGDLISFAQPPLLMTDDIIVGHSIDNRASITALTLFLENIQFRSHTWDVWTVATTQEEEGGVGAQTSGFQIKPDLAIAVDVTFARGPGISETGSFPLGGGVTIGWGASIHPGLTTAFRELADQIEIPYSLEIMPNRSGSDADGFQITAEGIPSMLISIPIRNMHTAVEMVSLQDIRRAGRLLTEFIVWLTPEYLKKLGWDD